MPQRTGVGDGRREMIKSTLFTIVPPNDQNGPRSEG